MEQVKNVFIQVMEKPEHKVLIKRGIKAEEHLSYYQEVGCDIWGLLTSIRSLYGEPVCIWLPRRFIKPGASPYVQGVKIPADYEGEIPKGFDVMTLPACGYLMFQGEPFAEEDYYQTIEQVQERIRKYDSSMIGYQWDKDSPCIQPKPVRTRGYVELLPAKPV